MQTNHQAVSEFHDKFGLRYDGPPRLLSEDLYDFRYKFLNEELEEFDNAQGDRDLVKAADALLDIVYVALGTALLMGVPWEECFAHVQRANITKERAKADGSDSKRSSSFDVIKPAGWKAPDADIAETLIRCGWTPPAGFMIDHETGRVK